MNKLIVFTRYPEIGTTKTRLIPVLGDENAMQLQKCMTEDTLTLCNRLALLGLSDIEVRFTGANSDLMRGWLGSSPRFVNQGEGSLGHRMESAFCNAFKAEYHKVIIIGTDCPFISEEILRSAYQKLDDVNAVLGPAKDGGYYLIGLTRDGLVKSIFEDIEWGTSIVLETTLSRLAEQGTRVSLLKELVDIDVIDDLEFYKNHINRYSKNSTAFTCTNDFISKIH